jgi:two-component system sensor histidine kinase UhpB
MDGIDASALPIEANRPPGVATCRATPIDLPRLVLRRALPVALVFLLLTLVLGLLAVRSDTRAEIAAALELARLGERVRELPQDDAEALASLARVGPLRHVQLQVTDAGGRVLLQRAQPEPAAPWRWLMALSLRAGDTAPGQTVTWTIPRAGTGAWRATVEASPASEEREALNNLVVLFGLLAACSLLMLAVMRWNVRRALHPLQVMLGAIARIEREDLEGVHALPPMPIRELEATSAALRRLAASLARAEEARRLLAQKVHTLQEDERQRLARDLHDEFGQRLTALRADAAWLRLRQAADGEGAAVAAAMGEQIARIQQDVRSMLARLQPLAAADATPTGERGETLRRLEELLHALAASWSRLGAGVRDCAVRVEAVLPGRAQDAGGLVLPRELVLGLYRISQEAFTNAARHADAKRSEIVVRVREDEDDVTGHTLVIEWSARDDGRGLQHPESALQRGNGLAGMRERVWALGGEFSWQAAHPPPMSGLALQARLPCRVRSNEEAQR